MDFRYIGCALDFLPAMEKEINKLNNDRVLTIKKMKIVGSEYGSSHGYVMEEVDGYLEYSDAMIECLYKDYKEPVPIKNRWELLDL